MNVFRGHARAAGLAASVVVLAVLAASALPGTGAAAPGKPKVNFTATLGPAAAGPDRGFGLVKFRQPKDEGKIIHLDVWVRDLAANERYVLQRATDSDVDDDCQGENWLTLGKGLVREEIVTNDKGTGRAELFRDLATVPVGTEFDIQFRVVDAATERVVVLESSCHQFTVSQ